MALHRRAAKRDDNEPEIRKAFERHDWHTEPISAAGMPDLLVFSLGGVAVGMRRAHLVDVKGAKGKATKSQMEKWAELAAKGIPVYACRTEADVDALVRGDLEPWNPALEHAVEAEVKRLRSVGTMASRESLRAMYGAGKEFHQGPHTAPVEATGTIRAPRPHGNVERVRKGAVSGTPPFAVRVETSGYDPKGPPRGAVDVRTRRERVRCGKGGCRKMLPCAEHSHHLLSSGYSPPHSTPVDAAKEAAKTFASGALMPCENAKAGCQNAASDDAPWCAECTP